MAIRITGMASGLDTDSMVKELVSAYQKKGESYTKTQTKMEWKQEAWTELNNKMKKFFSKHVDNMRYSGAYSKKKTVASDSSKVTVAAADNAVNGTQTLKINNLAKAGYLTGSKLEMKDAEGKTVKVTGDTKLSDLGYTGDLTKMSIGFGKADASGNYDRETSQFDIDGDTTVAQFVKLVNSSSSDVRASFDEGTGRLYISSANSGESNDFHFVGDSGMDSVLTSLGLVGGDSKKIDGEDAEIELNGVTYTSDTNSFSINGLTITAKDKTTGDGITLTTDTDYDGIYDSIKNFLKEYNELVNEMDKLYNADSAREYNPLTSDEKEEMSDEEIEKWETKIKDALLRRDSDLNSLRSAMHNPFLTTYEVNGKTYSLGSFGIETLEYFSAEDNERNAFHINGDEDDSNTSGKENKLKQMIATNPQDTAEFFQKLIGGLYTSLNNIQKVSNSSKSYGSFYSDKSIKEEINTQKSKVASWEKKVSDIEEKYYKQFSAMETAMTKLNNQQTQLTNLFGGM